MMTGYIHTVFPRQTVSFKMGSPLREVGVMHADVSTCIAGHMGKKADMLPVRMTVTVGKSDPRTFKVEWSAIAPCCRPSSIPRWSTPSTWKAICLMS